MDSKISKYIRRPDSGLQRCFGLLDKGLSLLLSWPGQARSSVDSPSTRVHAFAGNDTVCVQDVSGSMKGTDCNPSRLEASKKAAETYIRQRAKLSPQDRIALVAFNELAHVALPLTDVCRTDTIITSVRSLKAGGGTDINEGLKAAGQILLEDPSQGVQHNRFQRILLLTDGHGGHPVGTARKLKGRGVLIEVIGFAGDASAVNERLLRKVATTDSNGFTHYRFCRDTESLVAHYEDLATGIVFRGAQG
jgi:Mg-chelatase subunit ChlD